MQRQTIKEAFGGEVAFTKYINDNRNVACNLLEVIDMAMGDDYKVQAEHYTVDKKRVDLTVQNSDGNTIAVIESQDATGWLDSVHASKIAYYMYEKQCFEGVLLTEDATEHVKGFVQFMNQNTPFNIWLIATRVFKYGNDRLIDFVPVMRPTNANEKKIKRNIEKVDGTNTSPHADFLANKFESHKDYFTNVTSYYIDKKNVGNTRINVTIEPRKDFMNVALYHGSKFDNETFRKTVHDFSESLNIMGDENVEGPLFNGVCGRFKVQGWDKSFELFKKIVKGLEDGVIKPE
jgi:hypothetical protein